MTEENQVLALIARGVEDLKKELRDHRKESIDRHVTLEKTLYKHDERIRENEKTISRGKGIMAVLSFMGLSGLAALFKSFGGH